MARLTSSVASLALLLCIPAVAEATPLTWGPPKMTGAQTITIDPNRTYYDLAPSTDYVLRMPSTIYRHGGLTIQGGRNVTLIGGHIAVPETSSDDVAPRRGLLLLDQTGRMHVEGLLLDGPGLSEGIQMSQPRGATVVLENIRVGQLRAHDESGFTDNHPDVVQTGAGPKRLLIDHLSGSTDYQGLFLNPDVCTTTACAPSTAPGQTWDLRNIDIVGSSTARVLYWKSGTFPLAQQSLWAQPAAGRSIQASVWPSLGAWPGLRVGAVAGGYVPASSVGLGYRNTVGYRYG